MSEGEFKRQNSKVKITPQKTKAKTGRQRAKVKNGIATLCWQWARMKSSGIASSLGSSQRQTLPDMFIIRGAVCADRFDDVWLLGIGIY